MVNIHLTLKERVLDFFIFVAPAPVEDLECDKHFSAYLLNGGTWSCLAFFIITYLDLVI